MEIYPSIQTFRWDLQEWLYREEFEQYEKEGVLQMHTAFSREQAGTCPKLNLSWEFLAIIEVAGHCSEQEFFETHHFSCQARKIYVQHRIVEAGPCVFCVFRQRFF